MEPTAAAMAIGPDNISKNNNVSKCMIFDFGGGTLDVSVLQIEEGGHIEVLAYSGDPYLGG